MYCGVYLLSYPPLCPAGLRLLQVFGAFHISLLHRHIQIKALQKTEKAGNFKQRFRSRFIDIGSGSSILCWILVRIRFRIQGFDDQNLTKNLQMKKNLIIFLVKNWNLLISRPLYFSLFCVSFLPSWIRMRNQQLKLMRIRRQLFKNTELYNPFLYGITFNYSILCGLAQTVVRRPVVRQARVRISARHPQRRPPTERKHWG
jgi:hypothetical protein